MANMLCASDAVPLADITGNYLLVRQQHISKGGFQHGSLSRCGHGAEQRGARWTCTGHNDAGLCWVRHLAQAVCKGPCGIDDLLGEHLHLLAIQHIPHLSTNNVAILILHSLLQQAFKLQEIASATQMIVLILTSKVLVTKLVLLKHKWSNKK